MDRSEFLVRYAHADEEAATEALADVAPSGEPGYHLEPMPLAGPGSLWQAVVFRDETGVARGTLEITRSTADSVATVVGLFVDPTFRRQGIATRLYAVLERAGINLPPLEERYLSADGAALYHSRTSGQ